MVNVNGGYWGTAVADHDQEKLILTMKYYVLGQFTRYIRPGSRLIEMEGPAVAALTESGKGLTAVLINAADEERGFTLDVSAFGDAFPDGVPVRVIRTSGSMAHGEHWAELPGLTVENGKVTGVLAPFSVTTYLTGEN